MTYEPHAHDDGGSGPSTAFDELRHVRRSADDTVVAGVLGGLGRHFRIDPVVLRVTTVVLAIFGGVGVLLYALGWLLLPREDGPSVLDEARGRSAVRSPGAVPLAVTLGIVAGLSATNVITDSWEGTVLLLLIAGGTYVLLRRREDELRAADVPVAGQAWDPVQAAPGTTTDDGRWAGQHQQAPTDSVSADSAGTPTDTVSAPANPADPADPDDLNDPDELTDQGHPVPGYPGGSRPVSAAVASDGWPEGPDWDVARPSAWDSPPPRVTEAAPEPEPAPAKSVLTPITLSLALLATAALAINHIIWATVPVGMYLAVPLTVVALGLLAGVRRRRTKGLITTGVVLSVLLVPTMAIDTMMQSDRVIAPSTLTEVQDASIDYPAGSLSYDLSAVPFSDGDSADISVNQGVGQLTIKVPDHVDVTVNYNGGIGDVRIFGDTLEGVNGQHRVVDLGSDGEGGGSITVDVNLGIGELEVTR